MYSINQSILRIYYYRCRKLKRKTKFTSCLREFVFLFLFFFSFLFTNILCIFVIIVWKNMFKLHNERCTVFSLNALISITDQQTQRDSKRERKIENRRYLIAKAQLKIIYMYVCMCNWFIIMHIVCLYLPTPINGSLSNKNLAHARHIPQQLVKTEITVETLHYG